MTTLSGRVTVHGGAKAATTATVELRNQAGDTIDQIRVDDDGRYHYHLAAGSWHLNVYDAHGHSAHREVVLGDGEDVNFDIDLDEPEGGH